MPKKTCIVWVLLPYTDSLFGCVPPFPPTMIRDSSVSRKKEAKRQNKMVTRHEQAAQKVSKIVIWRLQGLKILVMPLWSGMDLSLLTLNLILVASDRSGGWIRSCRSDSCTGHTCGKSSSWPLQLVFSALRLSFFLYVHLCRYSSVGKFNINGTLFGGCGLNTNRGNMVKHMNVRCYNAKEPHTIEVVPMPHMPCKGCP